MSQLSHPVFPAVAVALLLAACAPAAEAIISSNVCNLYWEVTWNIARYGPIFMCSGRNATVQFTWPSSQQHGIFQIPSDKCPSNFTAWATSDYRELAPVSYGGSFTYKVPDTPGQYWLTSQYGTDCTDGMSAQIQVMDAGVRATSGASAFTGSSSGLLLAAATAAAAAAVALLL